MLWQLELYSRLGGNRDPAESIDFNINPGLVKISITEAYQTLSVVDVNNLNVTASRRGEPSERERRARGSPFVISLVSFYKTITLHKSK